MRCLSLVASNVGDISREKCAAPEQLLGKTFRKQQMQERKPFHTTTAAEFRQLAESARAAGRLPELIAALSDRLERYRVAMQSHQAARDFQSIQETKKLMTNLENKLRIATQLQASDDSPPQERPA